jgi:cyclopropane fatty-acyl-phospholipid synthase-like methyltransferase
VKVTESHRGDHITIKGMDYPVTREEFDAVRAAAATRKVSAQAFIDQVTGHLKPDASHRAILNAIWRYLPEDYVIPMVTR